MRFLIIMMGGDCLQVEDYWLQGLQVEGEGQDREEQFHNLLVGQYVVALYNKVWNIAVIEGEDPEEEKGGYTLLKYMERKGDNSFLCGKIDLQKQKIGHFV